MKDQLYVYDCLTGKLRVSNGDFMAVGAGKQNTFRIRAQAESAGVFAQRNGTCRFFPHNKINSYSINGNRSAGTAHIKPERFYLFVLSGGCFIAWYGNDDSRPDFGNFDADCWYTYNPQSDAWSAEIDFCTLLKTLDQYDDCVLATFYGLDHNAYRLKDLKEVAEFMRKKDGNNIVVPYTEKRKKNSFCCTYCYHTFAPEQAKAIATHPNLLGDTILGERCMKRFSPTQYSADKHPLDEMGSACHEYACPACHHKLPPFYEKTQHHRIAIVGTESAGKAYYMAALVHQLERDLPRHFGIPFRDADPEQNAALNNMRIRVFYSDTAEEFREGRGFLTERIRSKVWKNGEYADLPRPFTYTLNKDNASHSPVFYHATLSVDEKEDQEILKHAETIFFLFDPSQDPSFLDVIRDYHAEAHRFRNRSICKQSLLLTNIELYLRKTLNLPPGTKTDIPIAFIITKSDLWSDLLGPEPLLPGIRNSTLKVNNIRANSARLRDLLFRLTPELCSNVEAISDKVCYFAVSSFGTMPEEIEDALTAERFIAPVGGKLTPAHVTGPVLWFLSHAAPALFTDA